jgi:hypothetical protein
MCDERERLIGYVYDECETDERKLVEDHLESCATCRDEIGGLRDIRQDLLAWRVPDHEPVWRPLVAAAPVVPWWRQAPAWTLAAAASVMFLAGAAGGAVASRWLPQSQPQPELAVVSPGAPGVTSTELSQAEQRILQLMRSELSGMDQRVRLVSSPPSPRVNASMSTNGSGGQVKDVASSSEGQHQELLTLITQAWNDFVLQQNQNNERYQRLARELADLRANSGGLNR